MELKQIQTIKCILEEGSFIKAAEKLEYVQSTITLHIQQLENELGIKIFKKAGRRMLLSKEGEFFWECAKHLLEHADSVKEQISEFSKGRSGHVRIGAIETVGKELLTPILISFYKSHPDMKLSLEFGGAESINQRISGDQLDMGIGIITQPNLNLLFKPLFIEPMELLLPENHPIAYKKHVSLNDLSDVKLLLSEPVCSYRAEIEQRFADEGININSSIQISDISTIIQFVQSGIGCAILPSLAIHPVPNKTVKRSFKDVNFGLTIGIISSKEKLPKISEELYDKILSELKL